MAYPSWPINLHSFFFSQISHERIRIINNFNSTTKLDKSLLARNSIYRISTYIYIYIHVYNFIVIRACAQLSKKRKERKRIKKLLRDRKGTTTHDTLSCAARSTRDSLLRKPIDRTISGVYQVPLRRYLDYSYVKCETGDAPHSVGKTIPFYM